MKPWYVAFALALFSAPSRAQGLIQLSFEGALIPEGGAAVELELGAIGETEERVLSFRAHLAHGTTATQVAGLLAHMLARQAIEHRLFDEPALAGGRPGGAQLFVNDVTFVNLRLGHGLSVDVTLCQGAPARLRIDAPRAHKQPAEIAIHVSTLHHEMQSSGTAVVRVTASEGDDAGDLAERLVHTSIDSGWIARRPSVDSWSPVKMGDGSEIVGCSIEIETQGDWRFEVSLVER
jgi:hypothetical protein